MYVSGKERKSTVLLNLCMWIPINALTRESGGFEEDEEVSIT